MISSSSSFASSMPATSSKVTLCWFSVSSLARLLPNDIALPPPTCIWRMKKIHTPISSSIGAHWTRNTMYQGSPSSGLAAISTPLSRSSLTRSGSSGAKVLKRLAVQVLPANVRALDRDLRDVALLDGREELAEDDFRIARLLSVQQVEEQQHHQPEHEPERDVAGYLVQISSTALHS